MGRPKKEDIQRETGGEYARMPLTPFGVVCEERRQSLGLTARELCQLAGIDFAKYWGWTRGKKTPKSPESLQSLARALRIPVEILAGKMLDADYQKQIAVFEQFLQSPHARDISQKHITMLAAIPFMGQTPTVAIYAGIYKVLRQAENAS